MSNKVVFVLVLIWAVGFGNFDDGPGEDNEDNFNIIIFFAKTATCDKYESDEGIKLLNFTEKIRVKHSVAESGSDEESVSQYLSPGSDCKQLLRASLVSLISYCRNVMGMSTVIASTENDPFSNGLRFRRSTLEDPEIHYHHPRRSRGRIFYNFRPLRDKVVITAPEHTEVFKIRSKREYHVAEKSKPPTPPPKWDLLAVLTASINLTFFGKLLEGNEREEQERTGSKMAQSGNNLKTSSRVSDNSLFTLVQESLNSVMEECTSGFLMVVLGGNLSDISDAYSDLVQSVKHVVENTKEDETLIVVTGSCPIVDDVPTNDDDFTIPVYVRDGRNVNNLAFSSQLYDVPFSVKSLLSEMNGSSGGSYFASLKTQRAKRDVSEKEKRNGKTSRLPSLLLVMTSQLYIYLKSY